VERLCQRVTCDPGVEECCLYQCSLGFVDRIIEGARLVEDEPAKAGRCSCERGPGGFDLGLVS
jgi:hypothetical protein